MHPGLHGMGTKAFAAHYGIDEMGLLAETRKALDGATKGE